MEKPDILPAPVLDCSAPPENKWQRERQAFLQLLPQLLTTHPGKYVAIHEGKVVDSGEDLVALALLVYGSYGYVPIYCDLVTDRPIRPIRIPSPRFLRDEGVA